MLPCLLLAGSEYLGISQRLSCTLYEVPRDFPIAFGYFPAVVLYPFSNAQQPAVQQPLGAFPAAVDLNVAISISFLQRAAFLLIFTY
jgi:hypothetical protein